MEKKPQKGRAAPEDGAIDNRVAGDEIPAIVAGIGAGMGSLKPLKTILGGLSSGRGITVILIHHPELTNKNLLKLLKSWTSLDVMEATNGMTVLADRIYVMPPEKFLGIARDRLTLTAPVHCDGLLMPIDHFFCSLAADRRNHCCGILLTGGGGDGTLGLSEIRAAGGRTIVVDPEKAMFPDLPQNAIRAGVVDKVLPEDAVAGAIADLAGQAIAAIRRETAASPEIDPGLKAILDILYARVGHDFRCYKPGTLLRRIHRRMTLGKIATMGDYTRHLTDHPDEISLLQKDLLIGVTDFFRQPSAWEALENLAIAPLVESAPEGAQIRIWVPGCSTGKEVYSLAILLAEAMEKSGGKTNFQIFATDADLASLATARTGSYPAEELGRSVSAERLKRFFTRRDDRCQVIKSIRERVIFAAQNITADPPFSRLDLIVCRNLLIYLDQQVQRKIIALFHFALRDGGFLFLGNAETIGDHTNIFEPISKRWRIYRRIGVGHRVNVEIPARPAGDVQPAFFRPPAAIATHRPSLTSMAQQTLLDRFTPACVMIDRKLQVLYVHGMIENYLTIPAGELTTRVVDMAREGLGTRLRGAIGKCIETGRPVAFTARTRRGEKSVPVKATVSSLRHLRETDGLLLITFEDQRSPAAMSGRQGAVDGDVRQLADELKITREELQSTIDQLEGSNDQLKASNEEVTAANEELQSANEEMETSKEELQSLNEELNTINVRLQEKVDELESANNDVVNLLASASIATLFLDKQFRIKRFTPAITRLMSLIPSDLDRPFADILLRFTDEALMVDARRVLVDLAPLSREVQADDGRWYIRRIMPYRTQDDRIEGVVLTFVDVADLKQAEEALRESLARAAWLARFPDENPIPVVRASADGVILYCNPASMKNSEWACKVGDPLPDPVRPWVAPVMASGAELRREIQMGTSFYAVTLVPFPGESYVNVYGRPITKRKLAEESLRRSEERLNRAQEIAHLGSWELDLIDNRLIWSDEAYRIFGLQPQEFAATYEAFLERVHPDDRGAVDAAYSGSLRENRDTYEIEHRVVRKRTGEIRYVQERCHHYRDESGRIVRSVGMVHDITERKQGEEALRKLNAELEEHTAELEAAHAAAEAGKLLLESVMEVLPVGVAVVDAKGGNIRANRAFEEVWGGPRPPADSVHDYTAYKAWWPETGEPVQPEEWASARAVQKGESVHGQLLKIERFDGSRAFVLNSGSPVLDAEGKIVGSAVAIQDITELMQAEEALKERTRQLETANSELEGFSYTISHDLRAPLRAIDGYSRMLLRKHADKLDEDAIGKFNVIRDNTRMMGQLIDDLLDFSRLGRTQLSTITLDMAGLIGEVWKELKIVNPDRRLALKIAEIPSCRGDRVLIKQVLVNILSNTVKFTKGREEALIEVGGYHKDGEIIYYVRDNGVGFDMQYYDKLFGVFQRLHSSREFEGTGVGLAIVQRIVNRHGGKVWAEGKVDEGATFYFTLPA